MGSHINEQGEFQSDKYSDCPPGKVPLSVKDPLAQDLLFEYAHRRRRIDHEFSMDLVQALTEAGYKPKPQEIESVEWLRNLSKEKETDTHPCDAHPSVACMCKGACSCHFVQKVDTNGLTSTLPSKATVVCGECVDVIARGGVGCERHRLKPFDPKEVEIKPYFHYPATCTCPLCVPDKPR